MIIAIDPGKTVGYAVADNKGNPLQVGQVESYQICDVLDVLKPSQVVIESFRLYPHKARAQTWSSLQAPKVIGAIEHWCLQNKIPVSFQNATDRNLVSDDMLRKYNFWSLTKGMRHARDAARHLVLWLIKTSTGGEAQCL